MALNNVRDLIYYAYRDAVIVGEDQATLSGPQETEGLDRLNLILANFYSSGINIPFYTTVTFNMVPNQGNYVIGNILGADIEGNPFIELDFVNILFGQVQIPIEIVSIANYYNLPRAQQSATLPSKVAMMKGQNTSTLMFYYPPSDPYPCTVLGKTTIGNLTLTTPLSQIPPTYIRFLEFALAIELNNVFHLEDMPERFMMEYDRMFTQIKSEVQRDTESYPNQFFQKGPWTQDIRAGGYDV